MKYCIVGSCQLSSKKIFEPVPLKFLFFIFGKLVLTNPVVCACNAFIIYNTSLFLQHLVKNTLHLDFLSTQDTVTNYSRRITIVYDFDSCFLVTIRLYYLHHLIRLSSMNFHKNSFTNVLPRRQPFIIFITMVDHSFALDLQFLRSLIIITIIRNMFNIYKHAVCIVYTIKTAI